MRLMGQERVGLQPMQVVQLVQEEQLTLVVQRVEVAQQVQVF